MEAAPAEKCCSLPSSKCAKRFPFELYCDYPSFKAELSELLWADGKQNWNGFREVVWEIKVQPRGLWVSYQASASVQHGFCNVTQGQSLALGSWLCLLSKYEKDGHGHPQPSWHNLLSHIICDEDAGFESISALIRPSGGVREPDCKREPNKWTSSHIIQCRQWNEESSAKRMYFRIQGPFSNKTPLIWRKKNKNNPLLFLRGITIKSNKKCLMTYSFFKASKSGRKPGHLEKRVPRLSQYVHLCKGPLPWKYLQLRCYPAPSHSPGGGQGQSTAVGSSAAVELCVCRGKILLCYL